MRVEEERFFQRHKPLLETARSPHALQEAKWKFSALERAPGSISRLVRGGRTPAAAAGGSLGIPHIPGRAGSGGAEGERRVNSRVPPSRYRTIAIHEKSLLSEITSPAVM